MANYATLKAAIRDVVKTNGNNEITGALLQQSLLAMIDSMGVVGYQYVGIATPATNPGTPDQNVFYLASTAGTYSNFGGVVLADGEIAVLKYNGTWTKETTGAESLENYRRDLADGQHLLTISGKIHRATDGALVTTTNAFTSELLPVNGRITGRCYIGVAGGSLPNYGVCFYNENGVFISSYRATTAGMQNFVIDESNIPSGAYYFAVSAPSQAYRDETYIMFGFTGSQIAINEAQKRCSVALSDIAGQFTLGHFLLEQFPGRLSSSSIIDTSEKLVIIKVDGAERVIISSGESAASFAILKNFNFNFIIPYQLEFATGETGARVLANGYDNTLPADAKYLLFRANNGQRVVLPESIKINGFELATSIAEKINALSLKTAELESDINEIKDEFIVEKTINDYYSTDGYFKESTQGGYMFAAASGFKVTNLIPIAPGDIFVSNTSESGTRTVKHILFGANATGATDRANMLSAIIPINGVFTITQEMYNSGARYLGVSFRLSSTPVPSIKKRVDVSLQDLYDDIDAIMAESAGLTIEPVGSSEFNVVVRNKNGIIKYNFVKYYKIFDSVPYVDAGGNPQVAQNVVGADVWNLRNVYDGDGNYLMQGNSNFIFNQRGVTSHTGSEHGCEVILYSQFFADGKEIDPLNFDQSFTTFRMIWKTNVYRSAGQGNVFTNNVPELNTSGEPIINSVHLLDGKIDKNGVHIENSLTIKQNNMHFNQLHGAMLECYYGDFNTIIVNATDKIINNFNASGASTPIGESVDLLVQPNNIANIVEMYGDKFFVRQSMKPLRGCSIDNFVVASFNYSGSRLKNYFMPAGCDSFSPDAGVSPQTFNYGDIISVTCDREIELRSTTD